MPVATEKPVRPAPSASYPPPEEHRSVLKSIIVVVVGLFSAIYLFNPTAGILELIPDNIPIIGNLDEGAAVLLLLSVFRYFGVDLTRLFHRDPPSPPRQPPIDI